MTRFMWCSTRRTVRSKSSRIRRMKPAELLDLLVAEPARRLVQQQQPRPRGERARDLDPLLRAERQLARRRLGQVREARRIRASRRARWPPPRSTFRLCVPTRTFSATVIVEKSSTFWNVRAMPRWTTRYVGVREQDCAVEREVAGLRLVQARDHVEERRLAGAVRADQADDLPGSPRPRRRRARRSRRSAG